MICFLYFSILIPLKKKINKDLRVLYTILFTFATKYHGLIFFHILRYTQFLKARYVQMICGFNFFRPFNFYGFCNGEVFDRCRRENERFCERIEYGRGCGCNCGGRGCGRGNCGGGFGCGCDGNCGGGFGCGCEKIIIEGCVGFNNYRLESRRR